MLTLHDFWSQKVINEFTLYVIDSRKLQDEKYLTYESKKPPPSFLLNKD
jgi:hypothetical protein